MARPFHARRLILRIAAVTGLLIVGLAGCAIPPAAGIVDRAYASFDRLADYQAILELRYTLGGDDQALEIKQAFKKPDRYRLEFLAPPELKGQVTVFDGRTMWFYSPQDNEVTVFEGAGEDTVGQDQKSLFPGIIDGLRAAGSIKTVGRGRVDNRSAYILELADAAQAGDDPVARRRVWIDRETWLPLKVEAYDASGKRISAAVYRDVKVNVGLADDLFEFTIPEGVRVTEGGVMPEVVTLDEARKAVGFSLLEPSYLPAGVSLRQVSRVGSGADLTIVLDYGQGNSTLTISENRVVPGAGPMPGTSPTNLGGLSAEVIQSGEFSIVHWITGDVELSMTGNLPLDELGRIARSMR